MSSQINSPTHFNSVQKRLTQLFLSVDAYLFSNSFYRAYIDGNDFNQRRENIAKFIDTLKVLQAECVNRQYEHKDPEPLEKGIRETLVYLRTNKAETTIPTVPGLIKALQCILYQIEPEHLTVIRPLTTDEQNAMQAMQNLINDLCKYYVKQSLGYEAQKWSIE